MNNTDCKDTHNNIHIIMDTRAKLEKKLYALEREIEGIRSLIHQKDKILWKMCHHSWTLDRDSLYDPIRYKCIRCNLWRHPTRYSS